MDAAEFRAALAAALDEDVRELATLRGGDVAESYRVSLASGRVVFAKTHHAPPPGFFTTEAAGLRWLRDAGSLPVPEVLAVSDEPALLVLEWIDEAGRAPRDEAAFGRDLAALHRTGAESFGRADRRSTGSRGLPNEPADTWADFFATQRLTPIARLVRDASHLEDALASRLDAVADRMPSLAGPEEPPARLHGDLWAGNRLVDRDGRSWLIDPACFGGHREFDLAMMRLFGGFGDAVFHAYDDEAPLADKWQDRVALYQLAPLGIHAIKFGGGYVARLDRALTAIGA
jgi:fructosamine-3-kinase